MISAIYSLTCDWPDCGESTEIFRAPPLLGPLSFPEGWRSMVLYVNVDQGTEREDDEDWTGILCPAHATQFEHSALASAEDVHDA